MGFGSGSSPRHLSQHGGGHRIGDAVGVRVAYEMDGVQGGAGCEAGVSHPRHQVS